MPPWLGSAIQVSAPYSVPMPPWPKTPNPKVNSPLRRAQPRAGMKKAVAEESAVDAPPGVVAVAETSGPSMPRARSTRFPSFMRPRVAGLFIIAAVPLS